MYRLLSILSLTICLLCSGAACRGLENGTTMARCNFCNTTIQGKYFSYEDGRNICLRCRNSLPACKSCGVAVKKGVEQNGQVFCQDCIAKAERCEFCTAYLFGQFYKIGGQLVCANCKKNLPRCTRCNRPLQEYLAVAGYKLCFGCADEVDYCAVCHLPLVEKHFVFPDDSRKFCKKCSSERGRCDICTLPLSALYHKLSDGRVMCAQCMEKAVKTPAMAQKALRQTLDYLENELGMRIRPATQLQIVDARTLARLRKSVRGHGDQDRRALGLFLRKGERFDVYVESMLTYSLCLAVLAHEYTHAWQADRFPSDTGLLWVEGLAEWVAYQTLTHYGYTKQAAMITRQQDIYGQGFRKVQALEAKYGKSQVIAKVMEMVGARGKR